VSDFDTYYGQALEYLSNGLPPDFIKPPAFPEEYIDEIKKRLRVETTEKTNSNILGFNNDQFWYKPEFFEDIYTANYFKKLEEKKWSKKAIDDINSSTTNIVQKLSHPNSKEFSKCGIVVGYVQSGKTANYAGLISKTIDCGYNIIIILSGIHNNLRDQTQRRIENDLSLSDTSTIAPNKIINYLTSVGNYDFDDKYHPSLLMTPNPKIFIIKKNYTILRRLLEWFNQHNEKELSKFSTLIIDDEADNATIDISDNNSLDDTEQEDPGEILDTDPSEINRHIRMIRNLFKKVCYIGYTATPFANVLIDPFDDDDKYGPNLYPKDFIISLPKPLGYCGTSELFPFASNVDSYEGIPPNEKIHIVDDQDHQHLITSNSLNYNNLIPESLKIAFYHFLITGVIKKKREVNELNHSFLIHLHHEIDVQHFVFEKFSSFFELFHNQYQLSNPHDSDVIKDIVRYNEYAEEILSKLNLENFKTEQIKEDTNHILNGIEILEVNSESDSELDFNNENPSWKIIIGGNRLSRGLTIAGLTVTYFTRTSNYYDTLLQMGRWFGFRPGYEDLVRLFTTSENYYWFSWLSEVEESIRLDIARYENIENVTPLNLAVRVKTHPGIHVTSPIKLKNVIHVQASFDGRFSSMKNIYLDINSLQNNLNLLNRFILDISSVSKYQIVKDTPVWKNIHPSFCTNFINSLIIPDDDPSFPKKLILRYIRKHIEDFNELSNWSVVLANKQKPKTKITINDLEVGLVNRTRYKNLDSLVFLEDFKDFSLDLGSDQSQFRKKNGNADVNKIKAARHPNNPILVIYIIDKDSDTWKSNEQAHGPYFKDQDESQHIVAISLLLPFSQNAERNDYVTTSGVESDVDR
jgi:hypothetical protein